MILKIHFKDEWWLFDGLINIHFGLAESKRVYLDGAQWWIVIQPHMIESALDFKISEKQKLRPDIILADPAHAGSLKILYTHWVSANRIKGGEEIFFVFEEAYILNDDGKTIEVLG